jgi:hypothetical protein
MEEPRIIDRPDRKERAAIRRWNARLVQELCRLRGGAASYADLKRRLWITEEEQQRLAAAMEPYRDEAQLAATADACAYLADETGHFVNAPTVQQALKERYLIAAAAVRVRDDLELLHERHEEAQRGKRGKPRPAKAAAPQTDAADWWPAADETDPVPHWTM